MFVKRLPRQKNLQAHRISIGDDITLVVPADPDVLTITVERRDGDAPMSIVTVQISDISSSQPKICIDAPRELSIRHESSTPLS
jgi:sRNA-binding carbon storage regulator CsrA